MPTISHVFSADTGLLTAANGASFAVAGLANWGLFAVGFGILDLTTVSWPGSKKESDPALLPAGARPKSESAHAG